MGLLLELGNVAEYTNANRNVTSKNKSQKLISFNWNDS